MEASLSIHGVGLAASQLNLVVACHLFVGRSGGGGLLSTADLFRADPLVEGFLG